MISIELGESKTQKKQSAAAWKKLSAYAKELSKISSRRDYAAPEASAQLPGDKNLISAVKSFAKPFKTKQLKQIVLIGIGGSSLGTRAVYEALLGANDCLNEKRFPKMIFLDTLDVEKLNLIAAKLKSLKSEKEFVIIAASKSGSTLETVVNLETLISRISLKFKKVLSRLIVVSDRDSALWKNALAKKIALMEIPKVVGGRYSIFSPAGLLPLHLAGVNIDLLRQGAALAVKDCTKADLKKNIAAKSAISIYLNNKKGMNIYNAFYFNPELESCGRWQQQLMAESLGKKKNLAGKVVRAGFTPIVSIGTNDLHSTAQLFFGGPADKFTDIIYARDDSTLAAPNNLLFPGLIDSIKGKKFSAIMSAFVRGVAAAYKKNALPLAVWTLPAISEKALGFYMQVRMLETMYLAKLMNVNSFDQPAVEDYKKEIKKIIK
ncbi:MAG TPA: hypothetical protein VMX18_02700 [Candidatus Bipolaricaulota bacterium]|nr:hypothetical protein [Candidatus Bipolaricaulota bacterium]